MRQSMLIRVNTPKKAGIRLDFYEYAPGWVLAVATNTKTGKKAQAVAGSESAARKAALHKLK